MSDIEACIFWMGFASIVLQLCMGWCIGGVARKLRKPKRIEAIPALPELLSEQVGELVDLNFVGNKELMDELLKRADFGVVVIGVAKTITLDQTRFNGTYQWRGNYHHALGILEEVQLDILKDHGKSREVVGDGE